MTEWPISVLEAPIDTVPLPRAASPGPMHPRRMSESVQPGPSVAVQQTPSRTIPATGAPMSNSVLAQPAVSPQNEAFTAALAAHHARLVSYYWHYAQRGLVAPVVEGDDMQFRARNEAVEWARSHGVIVNDVGGHFIEPVTAQIPNNQPSVPTRQTSAPIMFQGALDLGPGPRPALPQPIHASTLPSSSRAASMPVPAMTSIAPTYAPPANVRPLPAVPPQRRPLPTPAVSAVPSDVLTGNVKYPSPSNTAKHNPSTTGPMKPLDRVASVAFSSDGTGKRPLPMPPPLRSDTDPSPTYASVQSSYPDDILARGLQSVAITVDEAPAAIPQIAPHPVQVTVLEAELSSSTTPIIAFSNSDEANPAEPAPAIALPSFSFGDDDAPVVQHSAQAAPSSSTARVHPRHDPSHPSHYLYHPTSTPSRLEAGAIACAGCRQQMFGRALIAMGREWHPDCFRCCEKACGQLLEMVQFDGCEEDVEDGDEDVDNVDETREPRKELRVYCMVHYEEVSVRSREPDDAWIALIKTCLHAHLTLHSDMPKCVGIAKLQSPTRNSFASVTRV